MSQTIISVELQWAPATKNVKYEKEALCRHFIYVQQISYQLHEGFIWRGRDGEIWFSIYAGLREKKNRYIPLHKWPYITLQAAAVVGIILPVNYGSEMALLFFIV